VKEEVYMKFVHVIKGKLLVAVLAGVVLIGGATAAFAATPAGRNVVDSISHKPSAATAPDVANHKKQGQGTPGTGTTCPGLPEAQHLASAFSLSTDGSGDAVQAICELHQGIFKGTTPGGTTDASSRVFGYGEIEMLLTYAHYLATHDTANTGGKLTSSNVRSYLAQVLHGCGTTPLETCLQTNIPGFQPGTGNSGSSGNQNGHGHGNGDGKPTSTPTPPPHH
jgi:hypothetical protein